MKLSGPCQEGWLFVVFFFFRESTLCIKVEIQIPFSSFSEYIYDAPDIPWCITVCGKPPVTAGARDQLKEPPELLLYVFSLCFKLLLREWGAVGRQGRQG